MKFPSIFKATDTTPAAAAAAASTPAWAWPSCANSPKTLSFRATSDGSKTGNNILKTSNSAYVQENSDEEETSADRNFAPSSSSDGYDSAAEIVVSDLLLMRSSDRLIFEPGETNSLLEEAKAQQQEDGATTTSNGGGSSPAVEEEESSVTLVAMDSCDPFLDFRVSMEEMIAAHGVKNWECLEDLLTCYLKVNAKSNHGYVIGAFMDLLVNLSLSADCGDDEEDEEEEDDEQCGNCRHRYRRLLHEGSFTSPLSFCSSSCSFNSPSMEVSEGPSSSSS